MWQQPTTPAPTPSLTGVFSDLQARVAAAVPLLVTAAVVFAVFYLVAHVGQRVIALAAPRMKADTGAVLLLSRGGVRVAGGCRSPRARRLTCLG